MVWHQKEQHFIHFLVLRCLNLLVQIWQDWKPSPRVVVVHHLGRCKHHVIHHSSRRILWIESMGGFNSSHLPPLWKSPASLSPLKLNTNGDHSLEGGGPAIPARRVRRFAKVGCWIYACFPCTNGMYVTIMYTYVYIIIYIYIYVYTILYNMILYYDPQQDRTVKSS